MTSERDVHPDEGTIHAWLDRQLDDASSSTLEAHLQRCDECAERVAEARGLIAGASRIITSLDDPSHVLAPVVAPREGLERRGADPRRLVATGLTPAARFRTFRLTPARSAIAAVLVVAVGLAILNENKRPTSRLAREREAASTATPMAAAPLAVAPPAPTNAPAVAMVDTTAAARVAAARTFARTQRETAVTADRAQAGPVASASSSPVEQTIAAAKAADSAVGGVRSEAMGAPLLARGGVTGGAARAPAAAAAGAAAPVANTLEAPQCYRVESATGAEASWGDVALPLILALDAPATRSTARVLTGDGKPSDVSAVFERRGGDSLLFTMRRIGYTGTIAMGEPGEVRAGVMRSAPATVSLEQTVVTATGAIPAPEARRAMRSKASAPSAREDSVAASAQRRAIPAVPVVARQVACSR
jgi:hypothetical protein